MNTLIVALVMFLAVSPARASLIKENLPFISYVSFPSAEPVIQTPIPFEHHTISGELHVPVGCEEAEVRCAAVVIVHGSAGVDSRGGFYAEAFNREGFATLEIDMWAPRGWLGGVTGRPNTPPEIIATLADAFGALKFLGNLPNIDPDRIAIMGFSFGGVLSMASATVPYTSLMTSGQMKFAAHIAHYPICWIYNVVPGADFKDLTGSPVLIQVGEFDDYHAADTCPNLAGSLPEDLQDLVSVNVYPGATHAWDRLQPPITVYDPFACFGQGCDVHIVPSVGTAFEARARAVKFLKEALGGQ